MTATIEPKISVILPVYNAEPFLADSIESILNQTRQDFELIIIDDCSTDSSCEIIRQYANSDSRIIFLINEKNKGVSASRNRCLDMAKGEFIALMDADDICAVDRLEKQLEYMVSNELDVCGSHITLFGEKEREKEFPLDNTTIRMNLVCHTRAIANPSAVIRSAILNSIRYDECLDYGEDVVFWLEIGLRTRAKFGNYPGSLVKYRMHPLQASERLNAKRSKFLTLTLYKKFSEIWPSLGVADFERHYKLIKREVALSPSEVELHAYTLNTLADCLGLSKAQTERYWLKFCHKKLTKNISVVRLYNKLAKPSRRYFFSKVWLHLSCLLNRP